MNALAKRSGLSPNKPYFGQILAKKSQKVPNEKNSQKKIFSKFQKRSKKVEKMIAERTEAVSEGGNRGKVAKKEK